MIKFDKNNFIYYYLGKIKDKFVTMGIQGRWIIVKKLRLIFCLIFVCILAIGCKENSLEKVYEDSKDMPMRIYSLSENKKYIKTNGENWGKFPKSIEKKIKLNKINVEEIKSVSGIVCRENDILLTDMKENCIFRIDYNGKLIEKIGKTGNGELEFLNPHNIKIYDDEVYILDSGNKRVVVLDKDLKFIEKIDIDLDDELKEYQDFTLKYIAVNDDYIMLNGLSTRRSDNIICIDRKTKEKRKIAENFFGPMSFYKDKFYAINYFVKVYNPDESDFFTLEIGENFLFNVDPKEGLKNKIDLSPGLHAADILVKKDSLYLVSNSLREIVKYDLSGKPLFVTEQILDMDDDDYISGMDMDVNGSFYISSERGNIIYKVDI